MTRTSRERALVRLAGRWEAAARDSRAVFEIAVKDGQFAVSGFDDADGEAFKISDIKWDGKGLAFVSYMPSTRHRVWHRLLPLGRGLATHELEYAERWRRVAPRSTSSEVKRGISEPPSGIPSRRRPAASPPRASRRR